MEFHPIFRIVLLNWIHIWQNYRGLPEEDNMPDLNQYSSICSRAVFICDSIYYLGRFRGCRTDIHRLYLGLRK